MTKKEKSKKMVLKHQYEDLSEEAKIDFRESYLAKSGMPYATFYHKLRTDTFRPLEQSLFEKLLQELNPISTTPKKHNETDNYDSTIK